MKKKILSVLVLFFSLASHAASGLWKTYLSYYEPTEIEKGNEGKYMFLPHRTFTATTRMTTVCRPMTS